MRGRIAAAELHDLASIGTDEEGESASGSAQPAPAGSGNVDPRAASELVARLKALPRSDVDAFLAKFGVKRVRDLRASDAPKARAFLDQIDAKKAAPAAGEIDPFEV